MHSGGVALVFFWRSSLSRRERRFSLFAEALRSKVVRLFAEVACLLECGAFAGFDFVAGLATSQARLALVPIRGTVCGAVRLLARRFAESSDDVLVEGFVSER